MNQIAALEVYIGYARKGYSIYKSGLSTIGDIKNGEFNLHYDFFLSLKGINPEIARYGKVADIINLQLQTLKIHNSTLGSIRTGNHLRQNEIAYVSRVLDKVASDCTNLLEDLIALTTAGKLEMEDDERLQRIDKLYREMLDNYKFSNDFSKGTLDLGRAREKDKKEIIDSRILNDIK
ncbi:hypothetical protein WH188_04850 [Sphingobacterium sp. MYb388]